MTDTLTVSDSASGTAIINGIQQAVGGVSSRLSYTYKNSLGNGNPFGADETTQLILTIPPSATYTINLQSLNNIANQPGVNLLVLRKYTIALLNAQQTAPDGLTVGNACSSITVGNAGSNPNALNLGGTTQTQTVNNGSGIAYADGSAAAIPVSGTAKNVLITNNDAINAAIVYVSLTGAQAPSFDFTDANNAFNVLMIPF